MATKIENDEVDLMLMAYADGELEGEGKRRIETLIAADPAHAERVEEFRRSRTAARDLFADVLAEPVPLRLVSAIAKSEPTQRRPLLAPVWLAAAACLAVAIALGAYWTGARGPAGEVPLLALGPEAATILGEGAEGKAVPIGSDMQATPLERYSVTDGRCRVLQFDRASEGRVKAIACDRGTGWKVEMAVADAAAASGTLTPASDRATQALDAYLDAIGAEPSAQ